MSGCCCWCNDDEDKCRLATKLPSLLVDDEADNRSSVLVVNVDGKRYRLDRVSTLRTL